MTLDAYVVLITILHDYFHIIPCSHTKIPPNIKAKLSFLPLVLMCSLSYMYPEYIFLIELGSYPSYSWDLHSPAL